jgi:hypothetical protein
MNDDRRRVLDMLAAGKVTADEAERLLAALGDGSISTPSGAGAPKTKPKYIRVSVDQGDPDGKSPKKVNIRVPIQLLRSGVRLVGLIPPQARQQVQDAMRERGMAFDLSQIKPENLEEIVDELQNVTIDVDEEHSKVRIFAE